MNTNNPFEGKAVKFDTKEQLDHLAELARGYGLGVGNITNEVTCGYFRITANIPYDYYTNCYTDNDLPEIHYSDFIKGIEAVKESEIDYMSEVRRICKDAFVTFGTSGYFVSFNGKQTPQFSSFKEAWKSAYETIVADNLANTPDMVNHPPHYTVKGFEVIDIIDAFGLNFNMGNALKYLLRADRKGNKKQDIQKALWYLQREINTK